MKKTEDLATSTTSRHLIRALKKTADRKRTPAERGADWLTKNFGSMGFLIMNVLWFGLWIIFNTGLIPGLVAFDPFPFGLLTMIVSLEAIALAIIVLISQNRASKVDDLREEIDLQVDIITEEELTKVMHMILALAKSQGVDFSNDVHLQEMLKPINMQKIEKTLQRQVIED